LGSGNLPIQSWHDPTLLGKLPCRDRAPDRSPYIKSIVWRGACADLEANPVVIDNVAKQVDIELDANWSS
jgi:hypothetical protein